VTELNGFCASLEAFLRQQAHKVKYSPILQEIIPTYAGNPPELGQGSGTAVLGSVSSQRS